MLESFYVLVFSLTFVQSDPHINWSSTLLTRKGDETNPLIIPEFSKNLLLNHIRNDKSTRVAITKSDNGRFTQNNLHTSQVMNIRLRPALLSTSRRIPGSGMAYSTRIQRYPERTDPISTTNAHRRGGLLREFNRHRSLKVPSQPGIRTSSPTPATTQRATTIRLQPPVRQTSTDKIEPLMMTIERGANALINFFRSRLARDNNQNPSITHQKQETRGYIKSRIDTNKPRWVSERSHSRRYRDPTRYNYSDQNTEKGTKTSLLNNRSIENEDWAKLLFGPKGILTALFNIIDQKQKSSNEFTDRIDTPKPVQQAATTAEKPKRQEDLVSPDFLTNPKPIDFAKFFNAFMSNSHDGFEDPIIELPEFLGICNRLSCGDIYKAIDQFRKSEFFSNFQTALQLIQDPKGWQIIGDLLSNPELISQFTGGNGLLEKLLGSGLGPDKTKSGNGRGQTISKTILPEDGDFGIDFSSLVEPKPEKERKPTVDELPEIAENVDGEDYYSAVESGTDEDGIETVRKPDEIISKITVTTELPKTVKPTDRETSRPTSKFPKRALPLPTPPPINTKEILKKNSPSPNTTTSYGIFTQATTSRPKLNRNLKSTRSFRENSDYYSMYYDD